MEGASHALAHVGVLASRIGHSLAAQLSPHCQDRQCHRCLQTGIFLDYLPGQHKFEWNTKSHSTQKNGMMRLNLKRTPSATVTSSLPIHQLDMTGFLNQEFSSSTAFVIQSHNEEEKERVMLLPLSHRHSLDSNRRWQMAPSHNS